MGNPVQAKVNEDHEARAPYNFIPLPEKVVTLSVNDLPDQGVYHSDRHTGYIDCELTTSSPMFVRAGLTPEQAKAGKESKDFPEFFYLNDKNQPVIPGSSLRGMLRTLAEIVTFSKIGAVSKTPLVYRSVGGTTNHDENYRAQMMRSDDKAYKAGDTKHYTPRIKGGYLAKVGPRDWAIQPAKVFDGTTYAHIGMEKYNLEELEQLENCKNAYKIFIKVGPYQYQKVKGGFLENRFSKVIEHDASSRPGLRLATLALSGPMFSKKSEAVIYERDPQAKALSLTDEQIDSYKEQISKEQQKILGNQGALNDGQPVFYLEQNGAVFFFGHARMFRVPYTRAPFDYIPDYARSTDEPQDPDLLDFTEAMFGYTRKVENGKQIQRTYAGRVFCSDAELIADQKDIWVSPDPITPRILSGPKPTTFQHYLVQIEPNLYDVEKSRLETRLRDFESPTDETTIRGHKFYWHKGAVSAEEIREKGKISNQDTQHTQIKPLKAGVRFNFRLRFENLSNEELGALMWIFSVAENEDMRLKIGMGKPLGLGAISIKASLFTTDVQKRYGGLFYGSVWQDGVHDAKQLVEKVRADFSDRILGELNQDRPANKKYDQLTQVSRIVSLLTILQWPGPNKEWTRYMEIEYPDPNERRGKRNEYKERPVLPTPFGVWSKHKV